MRSRPLRRLICTLRSARKCAKLRDLCSLLIASLATLEPRATPRRRCLIAIQPGLSALPAAALDRLLPRFVGSSDRERPSRCTKNRARTPGVKDLSGSIDEWKLVLISATLIVASGRGWKLMEVWKYRGSRSCVTKYPTGDGRIFLILRRIFRLSIAH